MAELDVKATAFKTPPPPQGFTFDDWDTADPLCPQCDVELYTKCEVHAVGIAEAEAACAGKMCAAEVWYCPACEAEWSWVLRKVPK